MYEAILTFIYIFLFIFYAGAIHIRHQETKQFIWQGKRTIKLYGLKLPSRFKERRYMDIMQLGAFLTGYSSILWFGQIVFTVDFFANKIQTIISFLIILTLHLAISELIRYDVCRMQIETNSSIISYKIYCRNRRRKFLKPFSK